MKYNVTGFDNFCRVFELPLEYPRGYCPRDGHPVEIMLVDWFYPVVGLPTWAITKEHYNELIKSGEIENDGSHELLVDSEELQKDLTIFLNKKTYSKEGHKYLVLCNFGFDFTFICHKSKN